MKRRAHLAAASLGVFVLAGCMAASDNGQPEAIGETSSELTAVACDDVSGTDIRRSLVVTDPAVLAKFSFTRVMNQVRTSAAVASTETSPKVFQRWMRTFGSTTAAGDCNDATIDPNKYGLRCPRPAEAKLAATNPFAAAATVTWKPVALFNRFDLAPTSGANCGEYRVVYAMVAAAGAPVSGRAFIIFEAALANPSPATGIEGCFPVAKFWQGLSADADVLSRAAKLEKFYFTGTAIAGVAPVVKAAHYGLSTNAGAPTSGQIRTNFFVDFAEWHLREFKTKRTCTDVADPQTCTLSFAHVTVKTNPANELFAGTHANAPAYRTELSSRMGTLLSTNVNTISLSVSNRFNEFESVEAGNDVVFKSHANADMRTAIRTKLTSLGSALTVDNVLDRATTQTCAGCHLFSSGQALGGGKTWPASLGFVQVDESSGLSDALLGTFLPRRKVVLEKFINDRCTGAVPAPPPPPPAGAAPGDGEELTVGGSPVGASN
jgi:hypothetical protein